MPSPSAVLEQVNRLKYKREDLTNRVKSLEDKLDAAVEDRDAHDRSFGILTLLSDAELHDFLTRLSAAAEAVVAELFGPGYQVSFKAVGKKGVRIWITCDGLDDSVVDSQGGGICSVISIALLLSSMAASDRLQGGFLLLDEPFGGAVQQEKLTPLYKRVSEAAASLGIQVIATTHHESAAECADNLIRLGCNAEIETV